MMRGGDNAVSIRARHCWRAIPALREAARRAYSGFNPRPPLLAGDTVICWQVSTAAPMFQSAPAIAGGRYLRHHRRIDALAIVSIRARHCWRAIPLPALQSRHDVSVSIRARHCWRAIPALAYRGACL